MTENEAKIISDAMISYVFTFNRMKCAGTFSMEYSDGLLTVTHTFDPKEAEDDETL